MGRSSIVDVKNSIRWYLGKSLQIENTWVCSTPNCTGIVRQEDISSQVSDTRGSGDKEHGWEMTTEKFSRQTWENRNRSSGQESKGFQWRCSRKRYRLPVEGKGHCSKGNQCSFWHESNDRAQQKNPEHNDATPSETSITRGRSVCRGIEVWRVKVTLVWVLDNRADTIWMARARERFVNICIHPSADSMKHNRVVKAGNTCLFPRHKVDNQPNTKQEKSYHSRWKTEHDTNDNVTTKTQNIFNTAHMNTDTWVRSSLVRKSSSCRQDSHIAPHGSWVLRMSSHPRMKCAVLLRLWVLHSFPLLLLPIYPFSLSLPPELLPLPWGPWRPCALRLKVYGLSWRLLLPHRLWAQRLRPQGDLRQVLHRVLTSRRSPRQGFLEDIEYDDTTLEDMLHQAHRAHAYHSLREGLSVGQSSSSMSERTGRLVGERTVRLGRQCGQELNVANAQIRTLLDRQKEQILAECQAEIKKHELEADYDRSRSVRKFGEIIESQH